jgi:hypothetical protein
MTPLVSDRLHRQLAHEVISKHLAHDPIKEHLDPSDTRGNERQLSYYLATFVQSRDLKMRNRGKWKHMIEGPTRCVVLSNMLPAADWAVMSKVAETMERVSTECMEFGEVLAYLVPPTSEVPLAC